MVKSHYYKHIFRSWHKSHNCATFFFNYGKCRTTRNYNYEIKVVLICLHSVEELKIRHSHVVTFHFILCWRVDSTRPTKRTERGFQNHTASTQVLDQLILRSSSSRYSHTIRMLCLSTSSETTLCKHPAFKTLFKVIIICLNPKMLSGDHVSNYFCC